MLGGYQIPKGSHVTNTFGVLCHRPDSFDSPEKFDPGHFEGCKQKPYAFRLFGGGNRTCPGQGLAMVEMTAVLSTLLQRYHFETITDDQSHERQANLYIPKDGLPVRITEHRLT